MNIDKNLGRIAALAILGCLCAVVWFVIVTPIIGTFEEQGERIARASELIAGFQRTADQRSVLTGQLEALRKSQGAHTGAIDGASGALAAAKLQSEMKQIIEGNGGEIRIAQNLPVTSSEGFDKIEVRYDLVAPMRTYAAMIYQIESYKPYLFLDAVDLHASENGELDLKQMGDPKINIRWVVRAYRRASP